MRLGDVLIQTFSGEWGSEEGDHLTPVLRTSNFNDDGTFDYASPAWRCIPEKKVVSKRLYRGDIVLEKSGGTPKRPVGIMSYYDSDQLALCSNFNQVLRVNSELMHPKYAFFQLRWLKHHNAFERYTRKTTGLQNIQMKKFVNLMILCPEISIQQEVVEQLEAISRQIKHFEYISSRLETLVKSRFVEMFELGRDWESRTLAECCTSTDDIKCGPFGSQLHREDYISEGVPVWGIPEINSGFKKLPDKYVSPENALRLQSYSLLPGDIAMNRKGNVGQAALFGGNQPSGIIHSDVLRVRVKQDVLEPTFLVEQLHSSCVVRGQIVSASTGAIMAGTNVTKLKKIKVFVPPLPLQQEFSDFVARTDKLRQAA